MRKLPSYCGCYSLTLDGVIYVGASTQTRRRSLNHLSRLRRGVHSCKKLQAAFDHSNKTPRFRLLEECGWESLRKREEYWINKLGAVNHPGSGVERGYKFGPPSVETRKKIGDANRRKW